MDEENNRQNNINMDSGLGSDDEKRNRTKAQKQMQNEQKQLFSGCFIDATSLGEDSDYESRRDVERRQGALIFQSSIPQYSMLQMTNEQEASSLDFHDEQINDTETPHNSMVHVDVDATKKTPIRFYVDLGEVDNSETPTPQPTPKKNIFSMTIDFNAPKREMPSRLNSSLYKSKRPTTLTKNVFSSSVSSLSERSGYISDSSSNQYSEHQADNCSSRNNTEVECNDDKGEFDSGVCDALSITIDTTVDVEDEDEQKESKGISNFKEEADKIADLPVMKTTCQKTNKIDDVSSLTQQFVKLSDLKEQRPRNDLVMMPRMSRSIPETSWLESPLAMLNSSGYRTTPRPFQSRIPEPIKSVAATAECVPPKSSVRKLGTDLLRMFLEEINTDITLEVKGRRLRGHRCILSSRCHYFAAILSGNSFTEMVSIEGYSYAAVHFALCHIYSGAQHIPESISLFELASLADMLGLEGLKEVVSNALETQCCHDFHTPCAGCINGVPEILPICATYGLDELYQSSLEWITKNFIEVWPNRMFASLSRELRDKCYRQHTVHMMPNTVLDTTLACSKLLATMPTGKWAESIAQLTLHLTDYCQNFLCQYYSEIMLTPTFALLKNPTNSIISLEETLVRVAGTLKFDEACRSYTNCHKLLQKPGNVTYLNFLRRINKQLESCIVRQASQMSRSNVWLQLEPTLKKRLRDLNVRHKKSIPIPIKSKMEFPPSSSSESSRNSSPIFKNDPRPIPRSPLLRKSLLLAAQSSSSSSQASSGNKRTSTLTKPTQSSAAKNLAPKSMTTSRTKLQPRNQELPKTRIFEPSKTRIYEPTKPRIHELAKPRNTKSMVTQKPSTSRVAAARSSTSNLNRATTKTIQAKSDKRSVPPKQTPKIEKVSKTEQQQKTKSKSNESMLIRSNTFLKEEPTVIGKM